MLYCSKCRLSYPAGKKFCRECGGLLELRAEPQKMQCPACGAEVQPEKIFCVQCGTKLAGFGPVVAEPPKCPMCGKEITLGKKFCKHCGYVLQSPATTAPEAAGAPAPPERRITAAAPSHTSSAPEDKAVVPSQEQFGAAIPTMKGIPIPESFSEAEPNLTSGSASPPPARPAEPPRCGSSGFGSGAVLGAITGELGAEPPEEKKPERPLLTAGLHRPEQVEGRSKLGWILGGAGVLLAAAAASWFFYFSAEARLFRAIGRGELVAPESQSAYDLFLEIERGGVDAGLKQKLRERVLPKLQAAVDTLLQKRREAANYKESELKELGRNCEWAAKLAPEDPKALARDAYARGLAFLVAGNAQEALPQFQRAVNYDANWAVAFNDLGRAYVKLGDHVHAAEAYQQAISLDSNWVYPQVNLGGVYLVQKDWVQAEQTYLRATQLDATLATPWYFLGQVYEAQSQYVEAIKSYSQAVALAATRPSSAFVVDKVQARIEKLKSRPEFANAVPPPPPAWPSRYWVRVFNCDDRCVASLDGRVIAAAGFGQDTGWVEVSGQSTGSHQLVFQCFNEIGAITYGFTVRTEQQTVFNQVCGQAGVVGCDNNQPRPRGLARQFAYQMMF